MGVYTFTMAEHTSPVAISRLFNAFAVDNHNLLPKVVPEMIKSVELVQGDGHAVGSINQVNFPDGSPFKYVKNRLEVFDSTNYYVKYTSFEGDVLRDILECVVYEHTSEPSGTGCHYKMTAHYHTKGDYVMKEEDIAFEKANYHKMFKTVEAYLIANPQVYA